MNARLPYIASRYTGALDEPILVFILDKYEEYRRTNPAAGLSVDTGDYYGTIQDFVFTLRYNLMERGLTVTPVIGLIVPSHDYRTIGEASAGQNLLALQTGVNVGRLLDPVAPNAYVHGRYTYSFVQSYRDIPLDRSTAEFEIGYAIAPTVVVRGLANWMRTHGGIPFDEALKDLSLFLEHDRLLASRHWHVGGGRDRDAHRRARSRNGGLYVRGGRGDPVWDWRERRADMALPRAARAAVTVSRGGAGRCPSRRARAPSAQLALGRPRVVGNVEHEGEGADPEIVARLKRSRGGHADPANERAVLAAEILHGDRNATDDQPRVLSGNLGRVQPDARDRRRVPRRARHSREGTPGVRRRGSRRPGRPRGSVRRAIPDRRARQRRRTRSRGPCG